MSSSSGEPGQRGQRGASSGEGGEGGAGGRGGEQGLQGEQGAQGAQGEQGAQGAQGERGLHEHTALIYGLGLVLAMALTFFVGYGVMKKQLADERNSTIAERDSAIADFYCESTNEKILIPNQRALVQSIPRTLAQFDGIIAVEMDPDVREQYENARTEYLRTLPDRLARGAPFDCEVPLTPQLPGGPDAPHPTIPDLTTPVAP